MDEARSPTLPVAAVWPRTMNGPSSPWLVVMQVIVADGVDAGEVLIWNVWQCPAMAGERPGIGAGRNEVLPIPRSRAWGRGTRYSAGSNQMNQAGKEKSMLHAIEEEVVLPADGKLPEAFHAAFGRRAKIIVLLSEPVERTEPDQDDSQRLMAFAGTIDWPMDDPVAWQRQQRNEWDRPWDC
ncbi:MAG: hypothetical protein HQL76_16755 [Magnetococcales bacterium]|nr:hypothetical protein [Magnetococcales bacterium]